MAFFAVTIEEIEKVWDVEDSTSLSLAKAKNLAFQYVIGRNQFKPGDKVVLFPIDSVLPQDLIAKLNMTGKFSGKEFNRVKSVKLRGVISQGYISSPDGIIPDSLLTASPKEITEFLGVTKYSAPVEDATYVLYSDLPSGFSEYDIEGADRYQDIVDLLMDQDVVVLEKAEGENCSFIRDYEQKVFVNQKSRSLIEKEGIENAFWKLGREQGYLNFLNKIEGVAAGIYGEACGPGKHGNIYKLKELKCFLFDIRLNGLWMDFEKFEALVHEHFTPELMVPVVFKGKLRDFLNGQTIQEASNGKSLINPQTMREGIVVRPLKEQTHEKLGRLIIKQRSPKYLAGSNN